MAQELLLQETYFSQIVDSEIGTASGQKVGKLMDLAVRWDNGYPIITCVKFAKGSDQHFDISLIDHWDKERLILKTTNKDKIVTRTITDQEIYVGKWLLDKQIIDLNGAKLFRVNDIKLTSIRHNDHNQLALGVIDIGIRGLFRRLGIECLASNRPNRFIDWQSITPLENNLAHLQLREAFDKLTTIQPATIAEMIDDLDKNRQLDLLRAITSDKVAAILTEIDSGTQLALIDEFALRRAAKILKTMPATAAADILQELAAGKFKEIIQLMEQDSANLVRNLMKYPAESAGAIMTTDYLACTPNLTVEAVLNGIRLQAATVKKINYIYIINHQRRLQGVISLRKLIVANPDFHLNEIMQTNLHSITDHDNPSQALAIIMKHGISAVPVVDDQHQLAGIITMADLLAEFIPDRSKRKIVTPIVLVSQKK
jgi:CBS domain-containing protein/sporulation protein YlmC with PRC-barrel domain